MSSTNTTNKKQLRGNKKVEEVNILCYLCVFRYFYSQGKEEEEEGAWLWILKSSKSLVYVSMEQHKSVNYNGSKLPR